MLHGLTSYAYVYHHIRIYLHITFIRTVKRKTVVKENIGKFLAIRQSFTHPNLRFQIQSERS